MYKGNEKVDVQAKACAARALGTSGSPEQIAKARKAAKAYLIQAGHRLAQWPAVKHIFDVQHVVKGQLSQHVHKQVKQHEFVLMSAQGGAGGGGGSVGVHARYMCLTCLCTARTRSGASRLSRRPCTPLGGTALRRLVRAGLGGHKLARVEL